MNQSLGDLQQEQGYDDNQSLGALAEQQNEISTSLPTPDLGEIDDEVEYNTGNIQNITEEDSKENEEEEGVNLLEEAASVGVGGAIDAAESIGGVVDLTGDTLKTGLNALLGREVDATENPFDSNYEHGTWLDIPDEVTDWNGNVIWEDAQPKTAVGKFGRGLVEFGLLSWGTAGIGGAALGGARVGTRGLALARSMGVGTKGTKMLKFIGKGAKIGSEGAIADLISTSSEHANIMNLANEHIPWAVPIIGDMVAVKPEDNPWLARFKSVVAGAGLNYVGHAIGAIYKGFWGAGRSKLNGATDEVANLEGNRIAAEDFEANMQADELANTDMALDRYQQGYGISRAEPLDEYARKYLSPEEYDEWSTKRTSNLDEDAVRTNELEAQAQARGNEAGDIWDEELQSNTLRDAEDANRDLDPFVNDARFNQNEKATYGSKQGAVEQHLKESVEDYKAGGDGGSHTDIISEPYLRSIAAGDQNIYQYVKEVADDMANAIFKKVDNQLDWKDIKLTILRQTNDILDTIDNGGDLGKYFKDSLDDPLKNEFRLYADGPGNELKTIAPTQKAANVLVMKALAKKVQAISQGALSISDDMPIGRQAEMVFDQMKVVMTENKKMGMMWGIDGQIQQQGLLSPDAKRLRQQRLEVISHEMDEYHNSLKQLIKQERWDEIHDLMELNALSDGKVRTMFHVGEYLRAKLHGGRMDDIHIKGRVRSELQGSFFNSVLSSFATPVKAVFGTNMIAGLRPLQAFIGAGIRGKDREMFMAAMQMQNMNKAVAESLQIAKRNWELGVKREGQLYQGKFDFAEDIKSWKALKPYYEKYGSMSDQIGYATLDRIVDINTSPFVRYSVNAMGAGDGAARTLIGRQYGRMRSAAAVWDANKGKVDWNDTEGIKKLVVDSEDEFLNEIFKVDQDGFRVVSEKGAKMAGDEAAMTRDLQENFKGFELISNIPGMKAFFPFVRTGFNYLDVTFQHTPLQLWRDKYHDLRQLARSPNPSPTLLQKYGLRPEELQYELALAEGRIAMGTGIISLAIGAAMTGKLTGDMPVNKKDRDLWKLKGIQPNSYILPNGQYVSYKKLEIFNTLLSTTANVVGHSDVLGEKATDEWLKKLAFMTSAVVVDQSMLSGVEDLARLMNPQSAEDLLLQGGTRYVRAHLPYSGLMAQLGDVIDANEREAESFWGLLVQRDAFFQRNNPLKYDTLNKERKAVPLRYGPEQPLWRAVNNGSPIAVVDPVGDELKEALYAIRYDMPETLGTYQGEPLSAAEKSAMEEILAESTLRQDLLKVVRHPAFKDALAKYKKLGLKETDGYQLKDQVFTRAIRKVFSHHKKLAMAQLLSKNSLLTQRVSARLAQKQMGRTGDFSDKALIDALISTFPK